MADLDLSRVEEAVLQFVGCLGESFDDLCSFGLTLGESYTPFDADEDRCDETELMCSQGWVRVTGFDPILAQSWDPSCAVSWSISLEVGVLRCYEIPEGGKAPTESQVLGGALQAMKDMRTVFCAAMACEVWDDIMAGSWSPLGPDGGDQHGGFWTFNVRLD